MSTSLKKWMQALAQQDRFLLCILRFSLALRTGGALKESDNLGMEARTYVIQDLPPLVTAMHQYPVGAAFLVLLALVVVLGIWVWKAPPRDRKPKR